MSLMRLRFTGDENATGHLLAQIGSIDGVVRVEEVADLMPQMDDPDSSSAGLAENSGPTAYAIEVDAPDALARDVRLMAERVASVTGAALEIEQNEMRGMSDSGRSESESLNTSLLVLSDHRASCTCSNAPHAINEVRQGLRAPVHSRTA